jgi:Flp pilus assembly protein TadG
METTPMTLAAGPFGGNRPARLDAPPRSGRRRGWRLGQRGAAAVEFAVIAGPLMTILFGFIATNVMFFTWAAMQDSAQFAARMISTGQVKNFANGAITLQNTTSTVACSATLNSTQAEYHACQGLPAWASFTVTASENCSVPSVTVSISVDAKAAALADVFAIFTGRTLVAQSVMMKEGLCP